MWIRSSLRPRIEEPRQVEAKADSCARLDGAGQLEVTLKTEKQELGGKAEGPEDRHTVVDMQITRQPVRPHGAGGQIHIHLSLSLYMYIYIKNICTYSFLFASVTFY